MRDVFGCANRPHGVSLAPRRCSRSALVAHHCPQGQPSAPLARRVAGPLLPWNRVRRSPRRSHDPWRSAAGCGRRGAPLRSPRLVGERRGRRYSHQSREGALVIDHADIGEEAPKHRSTRPARVNNPKRGPHHLRSRGSTPRSNRRSVGPGGARIGQVCRTGGISVDRSTLGRAGPLGAKHPISSAETLAEARHDRLRQGHADIASVLVTGRRGQEQHGDRSGRERRPRRRALAEVQVVDRELAPIVDHDAARVDPSHEAREGPRETPAPTLIEQESRVLPDRRGGGQGVAPTDRQRELGGRRTGELLGALGDESERATIAEEVRA